MKTILQSIDLQKILFLDIETVPQYPLYTWLPHKERELWNIKSKRLHTEHTTPSELYKKAGIFAEFGKIVCISVAYISLKSSKKEPEVRVRSFFGHDEKKLLHDFLLLINQHFNTEQHYLCAHNGLEFDFPYIARRALIQQLQLPLILDSRGIKPWNIRHLDTLDLWRFGDYKNYTSLELLTHIFNIPTPKNDIDGSQVADVYWKDNDLERIAAYCEKDTISVLQLLKKYRGEALIQPEQITIVS